MSLDAALRGQAYRKSKSGWGICDCLGKTIQRGSEKWSPHPGRQAEVGRGGGEKKPDCITKDRKGSRTTLHAKNPGISGLWDVSVTHSI